MQKVKIPISIEPAKAALKRMTYDGIIVRGELTRLAEVADVLDDHVEAKVECSIDAQQLVVIHGSAKARLEVACQRCGNGIEQEVSAEFTYTPVLNAAEESDEPIPEAYDEIELDEYGSCNLIQLVEDELILALPIVAMHETSECTVSEDDMTFGELAPEATEESKSNPFDVLKQLKS
jgi:uncharacterized protein